MNPKYAQVALRALHRCEYCRAPEAVFNFPFEVEHIIPLSQDGADDQINWALACRSCNIYKSIRVTCPDPETEISVRLFNPRKDEWHGHFQIDIETGEIIGLTPSGRATVNCLRMNSQAQLIARYQWIQVGIFP
jgi:hypothetical protein